MRQSRFKIAYIALLAIGFMVLLNGCAWGRREMVINQPAGTDNSVITSVTEGRSDGAGEAGSVELVNLRELPVSSEGMGATGFDGPVTWSGDGRYLAIQQSNLTAASTQVQIVTADSGERKAIVGGYNLHWDPSDPGKIIFTQHQYYGEPDYGSHEVTLRISQDDLFRARVFNDQAVPAEIIGDSAGEEEVANEDTSGQGDEISLERHTPDGKFSFFTKETLAARPLYAFPLTASAGQAQLLTAADSIIGTFDLSADGRRIVYQQIDGGQDEFGNWAVTEDQVKFYIADLSY